MRAVIPERSDQVRRRAHRVGRKPTFDRAAYRQRHVIENCVGWLKEARGVATRYEKLAIHYLGLLQLGIIRRLLRRLLCPLSHRAYTPSMSRTVARADLIALLNRWHRGELTAVEVHAWAEEHYLPGELRDADDGSAAAEVLAHLDMLDQVPIVPEDVPVYLELLAAPPGQTRAALERFAVRLQRIDYPSRIAAPRAVEPYAR